MTAEQLCAVCGTRPVRMVLNEVPLCDRCSDRQLSAVTGWPELPDPPPPQKVTGPDGRTHLMEFRLWRAPSGIVAEAQESSAPAVQGYCVEVLDDHDADLDLLQQTLRSRVDAQIDRLYLKPTHDWPEWTLAGDEVMGRLVYQAGQPMYGVVVDGRTLSWEEFGRALGSYEGWQFRLVMRGPADDLRSEADVIALPTPGGHRVEVFGGFEEFSEDDELFFAEWDEAEKAAVHLLRGALPDCRGQHEADPKFTDLSWINDSAGRRQPRRREAG